MSDLNKIVISELDEKLMRQNLLQCYGTKTLAFRTSAEHYRYLAEQIIALRAMIKRGGDDATTDLPAPQQDVRGILKPERY